jgi:hypothetical protein
MHPKTNLLFFVAIATLSSCTKTVENLIDKKEDTVYTVITDRPDNRIVEYAVKNSGQYNIKGSIDDSTKVITVYLPHFYELQYLEVGITLPDSATISPSDDELVPVFDTATPFKYVVTGKKGTTTVYTVKIVIQQPSFVLNELSSETTTRTINFSGTRTSIGITGLYMIPSYAVTTLHLFDADNNEVYKFQDWTGSNSNATTAMTFAIKQEDKSLINTDTNYWLEVHCYALKYRMTYPVKFRK